MIPTVAISMEHPAWRRVSGILKITKRAIASSVEITGCRVHPDSELSILLCGDAKIRELNKTWRRIDKATNVLSFPLGDCAERPMLGDIVISYETLDRESRIAGKPFVHHYAHMIVHGFLHLLGFDHESDGDAKVMEENERTILAHLMISDPYATGSKAKV